MAVPTGPDGNSLDIRCMRIFYLNMNVRSRIWALLYGNGWLKSTIQHFIA